MFEGILVVVVVGVVTKGTIIHAYHPLLIRIQNLFLLLYCHGDFVHAVLVIVIIVAVDVGGDAIIDDR